MIITFLLAYFLLAYLIGSIPFGFLIAKLSGNGDIRNTGSGSTGATNVMRSSGKKAAYLTFVLDSLKGVILPIIWYFGDKADSEMPISIEGFYLIGIFVIIGHCYPIWLGFKGGKGVATAIGIIICNHLMFAPELWWLLLIPALTWIIIYKMTKIVSLASIPIFIMLPVINYLTFDEILFSSILSFIVILRHKDNIIRLLKGRENSFNKKS